jgi:hypothetical protein
MAGIVRDLPNLVATSSGKTAGIGNLDDASSITIFLASSATGAPPLIQVSQFDPAIPAQSGVSQSTNWYGLSTAIGGFTSSVVSPSVTISNISFRGLRLNSTSTGFTAAEVVAFATKQISV